MALLEQEGRASREKPPAGTAGPRGAENGSRRNKAAGGGSGSRASNDAQEEDALFAPFLEATLARAALERAMSNARWAVCRDTSISWDGREWAEAGSDYELSERQVGPLCSNVSAWKLSRTPCARNIGTRSWTLGSTMMSPLSRKSFILYLISCATKALLCYARELRCYCTDSVRSPRP
jgi:hypothetical protein